MNLGQKVICDCYFKKVSTEHVVVSGEDHEFDQYYVHCGDVEIDDCITQKTKELTNCIPFTGIVVAVKKVPTERFYDVCENGYTGRKYLNISNESYVECCLVYFRMNGSRLVPIERCKMIGG